MAAFVGYAPLLFANQFRARFGKWSIVLTSKKAAVRKTFKWNTGGSDTRSALGSSDTNGPYLFIPQTSKVREKSSPAPASERSWWLDL
jgi:hypothetical protein